MLRNAPGFSIENIASNEENDRKCGVILEHLRFNQIVQSLNFNYTPYFGSVESCKALGEVVGRSTTLRNLSLHGSGMDGDGLEYIIEGLLSNPNSTLQRLEVGSNINLRKKGAELVEKLLLRNLPNLISLGIWGSGFTSEETAPVARALAKNTTLIELSCGVGYGITHPETEGPLSWIMKAFTPIDCLTPEQASYQDDTYNQTVRALRMNFEYEKGVLENLVQMLAHNSSLEVLALRFFHLNRDQWGEVWKAMKYNSKLEEMDLYRCGQGLGDAFDDMMDFLQANRTLKRIHLGETSLVEAGQAALVKQQLERNARLSDYLSTLNRSLKFVPPRIGRLFLCGYPRAGIYILVF